MDCKQAQEEILEMFDGSPAGDVQDHLASCPACAKFAARHTALDRELGALLQPPSLSPGFRTALRKRIREDSVKAWPEVLPDILHIVCCAIATLACAVLLPMAAGPVLAIGAGVTLITYLAVVATRIWMDA
jgi:anti-sigma factor RsiW